MVDKPKQDDPQQSKRFIEAAKQAEADESEGAAERAFKKVAKSTQNRGRQK